MEKTLDILVTGGNGQLGRSLQDVVRGSANSYHFTNSSELDITDLETVRKWVRAHPVDIILNCAAYTNVDGAEDNPEGAYAVNATGVRNLAKAAKETGAMLIHISTDYLFGGDMLNTPISESQQVSPTGVYGSSKLAGEEAVVEELENFVIIRTSWLYSEYGRNFLKTMKGLLETRPYVDVVIDQCGTPTYAANLAEAVYRIIENGACFAHPGLYHYSDLGVASWYDFACEIARHLNIPVDHVRPCTSDKFVSKVKRPAYSVLDKTKFAETFSLPLMNWREGVDRCFENLK